ncbi:MAG: hypothetical protein AB1627_00995 [Chloroflexota bacterium]
MTTKTKADVLRENGQLLDTIGLFTERLAELELALEDTDWIRLSLEGATEFSRDGLSKIITLARLAYLKNPLINRAVNVQAFYVWGQGVNIEAKPDEIDAVVQRFLDHPKNQAELSSHQARTMKEIQLQITSNLFFVLFTNNSSGRVLVRTIPVDEILAGDIITNPEDDKEPWFYKRVWRQRTFDVETGNTGSEERTAYYPDFRYRPPAAGRPDTIGGHPVHWDQPVLHVKVGGLEGMRFGVPEVYSALDWAKAVTKDLERYATLRAALARWAHKLTTEGGSAAVAAAKTKLGSTLGSGGGQETNPAPVTGSTFISTPGARLEAMQTRNALPDPDDGRRLGLMVSAGTGIPETILFGDAEVGNLATAKTLDRPTELKMLDRQTLWADTITDILLYVIEQAARKANGPLAGVVTLTADEDDAELVRLAVSVTDADGTESDVPPPIDVTFPDILERDIVARVEAIVNAATLDGKPPAGTIDPRTAVTLLLQALGMVDVDEILDQLVPEGTTWAELRPEPPAAPAVPGSGSTVPPADEVAETLREVRDAARKLLEVA